MHQCNRMQCKGEGYTGRMVSKAARRAHPSQELRQHVGDRIVGEGPVGSKVPRLQHSSDVLCSYPVWRRLNMPVLDFGSTGWPAEISRQHKGTCQFRSWRCLKLHRSNGAAPLHPEA